MWLQRDGASPHFDRQVTAFLNETFEGRWIGRNGPVAWRTRTPALNPIDFFLWGCKESRVCDSGKPEGRHQLVEAINEAAVGIKNELERVQWQYSTEQRLAARTQCDGKHCEHVLKYA
jgi:hypothetical protein